MNDLAVYMLAYEVFWKETDAALKAYGAAKWNGVNFTEIAKLQANYEDCCQREAAFMTTRPTTGENQ